MAKFSALNSCNTLIVHVYMLLKRVGDAIVGYKVVSSQTVGQEFVPKACPLKTCRPQIW